MRGWLIVSAIAGFVVSTLSLICWPVLPPFFVLGFWCLVVFVGLVFERYRYKPIEHDWPGREFEATGESFVDPETGGTVRVLYDPRTGERRYVRV